MYSIKLILLNNELQHTLSTHFILLLLVKNKTQNKNEAFPGKQTLVVYKHSPGLFLLLHSNPL